MTSRILLVAATLSAALLIHGPADAAKKRGGIVLDKQFRGCIFMGAAGEHKEAVDPVFRAALMHKRLVLAYFEELAHAARFDEPKQIADTINLLHEGAIAVAQMTRTVEPVRNSKRMVTILLAQAAHSPSERRAGTERVDPAENASSRSAE